MHRTRKHRRTAPSEGTETGTLLILAAASAVAELKWPRLQVERSVAASAASATGTFAFTNVGKQPMQITEVRTSRDAATAIPRRRLAPRIART